MKELVKGAPCSERTLRRAKEKLGIKAAKDGLTGTWLWSLPEDGHPPTSPVATFDEQAKNPPFSGGQKPEDGQPSDVATLGDQTEVWDYRRNRPVALPSAAEVEAKAKDLGLTLYDDEDEPA